MKEQTWLTEPQTIAVIDIETALDEEAAHVAGHKGTGMRPALQKLVTACLLVAAEQPDGSWGHLELRRFTSPLAEFDVLMALDDELRSVDGLGGMLVTYNGREHDLAVLRRRAARYWMFGLPGLSRASEMNHLDLMLWQRRGRRDAAPSLRDTCAGLGIALYADGGRASAHVTAGVRKCEADVVATFILYLFEAAIARGSPDVLLSGWEAVTNLILGKRPYPEHLRHFASNPHLKAAQLTRKTF